MSRRSVTVITYDGKNKPIARFTATGEGRINVDVYADLMRREIHYLGDAVTRVFIGRTLMATLTGNGAPERVVDGTEFVLQGKELPAVGTTMPALPRKVILTDAVATLDDEDQIEVETVVSVFLGVEFLLEKQQTCEQAPVAN